MIRRRQVGWCVAWAYALVGARRRALRRCATPGCVLPIAAHGPRPDEFRHFLAALRDFGFRFVSTEDVRSGRATDGRCAWISFDDGFAALKGLLPVLEEFEAPATVFVAPGESQRGYVWTDGFWNGLLDEDFRAWYGLSADERYARVDAAWRRADRSRFLPLLRPEDIAALSRHPLVTIGNHTWSHMSATHRPAAETLSEIDRAQKTLADWTGCEPTAFAYPFGRGTAELDAEIRNRGLLPFRLRPGLATAETFGSARNLFLEGMTLAENLGRVLQAWPKVGETR